MGAANVLARKAGGAHMLERLRKVLDFQLTIGQLIAIGLIVGTPYLLVGTIWSTTHTDPGSVVRERLHDLSGDPANPTWISD
jgi:hypothetical protein